MVTKPGEPALPLAVINVTPNDSRLVLRGIGYRGGTFVDSGPVVPFTGAATTESRGVHVPFLSPVFYPSTMWTPNYFGALAGNGGTQLLVTPAQYRAASVADGTSTQRKHDKINLRLFYSGNLSQAALSDAPSIVAVDAQLDAAGVEFTAQVVGDPLASIYQVWVTYTGGVSNAWESLDLAQCTKSVLTNSLPAACGTTEDSRLWKGRLSSPPANMKYFVQAANGVGLVSRNDNFGAYFGIASVTPTATTLALVSPPSSATVGDSPSVTAKLTYAGGVGMAGKLISVGVGGAARLGITGSDGSVSDQDAGGGQSRQLPDHRGIRRRRGLPAVVRVVALDHQQGRGDADGAAGERDDGRHQHFRGSRRYGCRTAAGTGGVHRDRWGWHDDHRLRDHRLSRQRDVPATVGAAPGQLQGDPGVVRR